MSRATFETLSGWEIELFYLLIPVTLAVFFFGLYRLIRKYRSGHGNTQLDAELQRALRTVRSIALHRDIGRRDLLAGAAHAAIFYGFIGLAIATGILMVNNDFTKPLFGIDFWRGTFYEVYKALANIAGAALVVGVGVMAIKRLARPRRYDYARADSSTSGFDRRLYVVGDWWFLGWLFFMGVTGFVMEAARMAVENQSFDSWSNVGWLLSRVFRAGGMTGPDPLTQTFRHILWWSHAGVALVGVAAIPYTKALHILASPVSVATADSLPKELGTSQAPALSGDRIGYASLSDFAPHHLLSLDACTKCGKCHLACPATAAGTPLSPRDLILDLREAAEGSRGIRALLGVHRLKPITDLVKDGIVSEDALWSCTTCSACVDVCPVGIQHVPMIVQMRRHLVEEAVMDEGIQRVLEGISSTGNSFGASRRKRPQWVKGISPQPRDARIEPVEYLWFVGDYGSYDPSGSAATTALAQVLGLAGVDFGILYEAEKTAGCDVRRAGEEGLWQALAEENIALLNQCDYRTILTADPHTYHTLKNEYSALGLAARVVHHTELLSELLTRRVIEPARLGITATYHDPCYLGRYNGIYDQPREVLRSIGVSLVEMPRNRDNSFCCGAGGGVIWMKERENRGKPRAAEQRIQEALDLGVDTFVVACPKDAAMFTAAVKAVGCDGRLLVVEISELVYRAVAASTAASQPSPVA